MEAEWALGACPCEGMGCGSQRCPVVISQSQLEWVAFWGHQQHHLQSIPGCASAKLGDLIQVPTPVSKVLSLCSLIGAPRGRDEALKTEPCVDQAMHFSTSSSMAGVGS